MSVLPVDSLATPRFVGVPTFMRLPLVRDATGLDAAVIGLPSDSGAPFRTGERFAPNAVRAMSVMLRPINPYRRNIHVFEALKVGDAGDAPTVPGYVEESLRSIEDFVRTIVDAGAVPFAIGGDHSVTLAGLRAVAARHGPLALVHFDAHSDTWDRYFAGKRYSAGTPFRRAAEEGIVAPAGSIQIGMRGSLFAPDDISQSRDLGYDVVTTDEMLAMGAPALAARIHERTAGHPVYISLDLDFIDPAAAPGVATPEAGGPSARDALDLIRSLNGLRLVGCDVVEICPSYDNASQITALLGATILAEFLALHAEGASARETVA